MGLAEAILARDFMGFIGMFFMFLERTLPQTIFGPFVCVDTFIMHD